MANVVYPELRLRFLHEDTSVQDVILRPTDQTTIGKDVAKLNLEQHLRRSPLEYVSRTHLTIGCNDHGWFVEDSSLNGTWLRNFKLERGRRYPLQHGYIIALPDQSQPVYIRIELEGTHRLIFTSNERLCPAHQDDLKFILTSLEQLKSVHLVGPCGIGKSIILQELLRPEVQQRAEVFPPLLLCDVDLKRLHDYETSDFYILVAHTLAVAVRSFANRFEQLPAQIEQNCADMEHVTNESGFYPILIHMLRRIGETAAHRVVFVLRHFEIGVNALSPTILADIQALHRDTIWHPLFICTNNESLTQTTSEDNSAQIAGLVDVFSERRLHPLEPEDLSRYLQIHTSNAPWLTERIKLIHELSGGWPSIARAVTNELAGYSAEQFTLDQVSIQTLLAQTDSISSACSLLLSDLIPGEREALTQLALGAALFGEQELAGKAGMIERLVNKGILHRNRSRKAEICSSLLAGVIRNADKLGPERDADNSIDSARGVIQINGRELWVGDGNNGLTALEYRLLAYLLQHPNEVVTYDDMLTNVYKDENYEAGGTARLQRLIGRLRAKVENDPHHAPVIENVRGIGVRLVQR